jgi:hypothetical protein
MRGKVLRASGFGKKKATNRMSSEKRKSPFHPPLQKGERGGFSLCSLGCFLINELPKHPVTASDQPCRFFTVGCRLSAALCRER